MPDFTVIIHGWSDCSESFRDIKRFLVEQGVGNVRTIYYGDYESREDNITFNDVADGLNDEFRRRGFIDAEGKKLCDLNVIVHSTGGLVIRHWLWRYYARDGNRIADCPVKRLVMLAPANFGSPLAHRGKSFLGSLFKGRWKIGDFLEVGRQLLEGLELASPYQWELAHRDLLVTHPYFNAREIQATILVGIQDYTGLRGWVNKPGTDGTVVIPGTSLDSAKLVLDFSKPRFRGAEYVPYEWALTNPPDEFAFGVLEKLDHGTIVDEIAPGRNSLVGKLVLKALRTQAEQDFQDFRAELEDITATTYRTTRKPKYQQFLLRAVDDQGVAIRDFTVEFFVFRRDPKVAGAVVRRDSASDAERDLSQKAHAILSSEFHAHSVDPSYRRLLVDLSAVNAFVKEAQRKLGQNIVLSMRVYVPKVDNGIRYHTDNLQNIVLYDPSAADKQALSFFYENTTTLVELQVDRYNEYVSVGTEPRKH
jgi:pimeloyl-ACP methyl ester carboxylesterase